MIGSQYNNLAANDESRRRFQAFTRKRKTNVNAPIGNMPQPGIYWPIAVLLPSPTHRPKQTIVSYFFAEKIQTD